MLQRNGSRDENSNSVLNIFTCFIQGFICSVQIGTQVDFYHVGLTVQPFPSTNTLFIPTSRRVARNTNKQHRNKPKDILNAPELTYSIGLLIQTSKRKSSMLGFFFFFFCQLTPKTFFYLFIRQSPLGQVDATQKTQPQRPFPSAI